MAYAHCPIELDGHRYEVNDQLPDDFPDLHLLIEHGSAGLNQIPVQIAAGDSGASQETTA
jgi:hypothetical protein